MVELGQVVSQTTTQEFKKTDIEGLIVKGRFTYNMDNKITSANGEIAYAENSERMASFNTYVVGDKLRTNMSDCEAGKLGIAGESSDATLTDLGAAYPTP